MLFFLDKDLANTFQYFQKMCLFTRKYLPNGIASGKLTNDCS